MRWTRALAVLPILLTGCDVAGSCDALPLRAWSEAETRQLVTELEAAGSKAVWPMVVVDYARLRAAVRACRTG